MRFTTKISRNLVKKLRKLEFFEVRIIKSLWGATDIPPYHKDFHLKNINYYKINGSTLPHNFPLLTP